MTEQAQGRQQRRSKLWIAVLALTILVLIIVVPPLVSINRYKSQIVRVMSSSLRRPVHLSGVELRLFPRPGFVITDLTVEEDPAYGAEPVLHANEVKASIRLFSLWRGRMEISRVSVDEASLNLVRTDAGRWNLDTLFQGAAEPEPSGAGKKLAPLPYLEATNSRINVKKGIEKLPYSLVNADLSLWEENPGDWRVRLKGQPARTDVSLDLGDTGVVRLDGRMRIAPELSLMPVHIEMEWREAQLGQLSRLLIGSDPGWRGDLTAEMKLDGTAESARVTTRLRASGVHRAEFAPAVPLDFDANCSLIYHYSEKTVDQLTCNSPLGDGRLLIEGSLPADREAKLSLALERIPAQAVLDALRTVRSEVGEGLEASGTISGKLDYDPSAPVPAVPPGQKLRSHGKAAAKQNPLPPGPLTGSIILDQLRLSGGSLSQPIQFQRAVLEPTPAGDQSGEILGSTVAVPAGAPTPLQFVVKVSRSGYDIAIKGPGTPARLRQMAQAAGLKEAGVIDKIGGDPLTLDLTIAGPWLPVPEVSLAELPGGSENLPVETSSLHVADRVQGTVTLRNVNWRTDSLPNPVQIPQALLRLNGGSATWDPVAFVYGSLKGTARVSIPVCSADLQCPPTVSLDFPTLDAAELQATLLGAEKKETVLDTVIARLAPSPGHSWPSFQGTLKAGTLVVGPLSLEQASVEVKVSSTEAELTNLEAEVLGGHVQAAGKILNAAKPGYSLEGRFEQVNSAELCPLLELKCNSSRLDGGGTLDLSGYTAADLTASANGSLSFDWKKGSITGRTAGGDDPVPALLSRFEDWNGAAKVAGGALKLGENHVGSGQRKASVSATVGFGHPPEVSFSQPPSTSARKQ